MRCWAWVLTLTLLGACRPGGNDQMPPGSGGSNGGGQAGGQGAAAGGGGVAAGGAAAGVPDSGSTTTTGALSCDGGLQAVSRRIAPARAARRSVVMGAEPGSEGRVTAAS
jgi:hypothetical protein